MASNKATSDYDEQVRRELARLNTAAAEQEIRRAAREMERQRKESK
ncbi:hypothetical protein [Actinomadura atramentaria]|nr:hypothetical protein [Actinomadura atramentaria]